MIPYIIGLAVVGLGASLLLEDKKPVKVAETGQTDKGMLLTLAAAADEHERNQP